MKKMHAAAKLTNPNVHASFGLRFLMEVAKELMLSDNAITEIFEALSSFNYLQEQDLLEEPNEEDENYDSLAAEVTAKNEEIIKHNTKVQRIQRHAKFVLTEEGESIEIDYAEYEEACLVRL